MAGDYYSVLNIDGVTKDIYDKHAIHEDDFNQAFSEALSQSAIKQALIDAIFPVGSYYITESDSNPSTFLGGTWERVVGRFIVGAGTGYANRSEGGYADAIVPEHSHTAGTTVEESGEHVHTISGTAASAGNHRHDVHYTTFKESGSGTQHKALASVEGSNNYHWSGYGGTHAHDVSGSARAGGKHGHTATTEVFSAGETATGKNIPPYRAANIWRRTA